MVIYSLPNGEYPKPRDLGLKDYYHVQPTHRLKAVGLKSKGKSVTLIITSIPG